MSTGTHIIAPPLQAVRVAVWHRLNTHPATSGHTLLREGTPAAFPYYAVGPAYLGSGGTDTIRPVRIVVQLEAYALSSEGGSSKVSDMMIDVETAVNAEPMSIPGHQPFLFIFEHAVINPHLEDFVGGEMYAQMIHRYQIILIRS